MGDMPNWHRFVDSVLSERRQDKPDKQRKEEKGEDAEEKQVSPISSNYKKIEQTRTYVRENEVEKHG